MNIDDLIQAAFAARTHSYSPYSGYAVGAAILASDDSVWTGCNVENVSYGLSLCAERVALFKMVSEGPRVIQAVAVATKDGGTPCGACLQALFEFTIAPEEVVVIVQDSESIRRTFKLSELMPHAYTSSEVNRNG